MPPAAPLARIRERFFGPAVRISSHKRRTHQSADGLAAHFKKFRCDSEKPEWQSTIVFQNHRNILAIIHHLLRVNRALIRLLNTSPK